VALTHDFLKVLLFSPVTAIPPMLNTHHHHHHHHHKTTLIRRTRGQSLGSFEQSDAISGTGQQTVVTLFRLTVPHTQPRILSRLLQQNLVSSLSLSPCAAVAPPITPVTSVNSTTHDDPHYTVLYILLSLSPSQIAIFL
jgi:hypothetical protein